MIEVPKAPPWPCVECGITHSHDENTCCETYIPDAYVIEVTPSNRQGRGRWWAPRRKGYTSTLGLAGLYTREEATRIASSSDRGERAVPLVDVLRTERARWNPDADAVWTVLGWFIPGTPL